MKDTISILKNIKNDFIEEVKSVKTNLDISKIRIKFLGRKSKLNTILKSIKNLEIDERKKIGKLSNNLKKEIESELSKLTKKINEKTLPEEIFDLTQPGKNEKIGFIHPLTKTMWEIGEIFTRMGFEIFDSFEVDTDYNNFTSLNIPEGHPARDIWDTFWTEDDQVIVTHTSSMQNRILKSSNPPIRAVVMGKVFRNERTDARHEHTLHQCEGVYIDKDTTFSDMLGTLGAFFSEFFKKDIKVRVSPDYFPFVEPGNGMALSCTLCNMKGCRVCKYTGWLEILGCGMIHPNVLKEGGIDPDVYSGFAWGFGIERIAMLKSRIDDVRHFHSGNLKFIEQFN